MLYHIFIDPVTHIVEHITRFSNHDIANHIRHVHKQSFISGNSCEMFTMTDKDIPKDMLGILEQRPILFVYNKQENKFLKRPMILLYLDKDIDPNKVPINTDITIHVKYYNPDFLDFKKNFEKLKVKDRAGLVEVPEFITLDDKEESLFVINSDIVGRSIIRVKDEKYICYFEPLVLRFVRKKK